MSIKKLLNKNIDLSSISKKYVLLSLCIILFLLIIIKIFPYKDFLTEKNIKMSIKKNKDNITSLYTDRNISYENSYFISTIDFKNGKELIHNKSGNYSYASNFFIDIETKISVLKDGTYNFTVYSDDGFNLKINDELLMEFTDSRPLSSNEKKINISQGVYDLKISYFQGYGLLGLKAYYENTEYGKKYLIGEKSDFIKFIRP